MKTILSISCFFLSICFSFAQTNFEGVIKWSVKMTSASGSTASAQMTDKQKAELNESIEELESQLNNPEMKAMFESNPSMKSTLENQLKTMKSMQGGDGGMSSLMPKSFTIKSKDGNSLTIMDGGMAASMGEILHLKTTDKTYYIKRDAKTYSVAPAHKPTQDSSIVTVVATAETKKILTYNCTKYIVSISKKGEKQNMIVWATKDLKQFDVKAFHNSNMGGKNSYSDAFKKIDGIPLAMEMKEQGQGISMEVIELKSTTLPASDFAIPTGFKEVPFGQ